MVTNGQSFKGKRLSPVHISKVNNVQSKVDKYNDSSHTDGEDRDAQLTCNILNEVNNQNSLGSGKTLSRIYTDTKVVACNDKSSVKDQENVYLTHNNDISFDDSNNQVRVFAIEV